MLLLNISTRCFYAFFIIFFMALISSSNGDCGPPPRLQYAELTNAFQGVDNFVVGAVVNYTCQTGYQRIPRTGNTRTCQADASWTEPTVFCELRRCSSLGDIPNGQVHIESLTFGSEVIYTCNEGYRFITKIRSRTCEADGTWSGVEPVCEVVTCSPPDPVTDGSYNPVNDEYNYQNSVTFKCNGDLTLVGEDSVFCTAQGNWSSSSPQCKDVRCSDPVVPNSHKLSGFGGPYILKSPVSFACNDGFTMEGSSTVTCSINSTWEPALPKCLTVTCPNPQVPNAREVRGFTGPYTLNTALTFACEEGYSMSGSKSVKCNANGKWEPPLPKCLIECPTPTVQNAERLYGSTGPYLLNSTVSFACSKGFVLSGNDTVKCSINGKWEPPLPQCQSVACPNPQVPNAREVLGFTGPYTLNTALTFACEEGYSMSGSKSVKCNANGKWEPPLPKCLSDKENEGGSGSSVGAIIGGCIGALVVIAGIGLAFWYKKKQGKPKTTDYNAHYKSCSA